MDKGLPAHFGIRCCTSPEASSSLNIQVGTSEMPVPDKTDARASTELLVCKVPRTETVTATPSAPVRFQALRVRDAV
jgi:hypothetical protein